MITLLLMGDSAMPISVLVPPLPFPFSAFCSSVQLGFSLEV